MLFNPKQGLLRCGKGELGMVNVPDFCERGILTGPFEQCDKPPQADTGRAIFSVWLNSRLLAALAPLSFQQMT
uniref:hypothetical protein n=1 Tax=Pseudomonas aeruginosa TaxID=287 RepID=UPI001882BE91|nr:hypothetical protein [Pseudomonas aeruginosa]